MKRCPECRRDYFDDSLLYCLDDGTALLEGPATAEQKTVTLPPDISGEARTRRMEVPGDTGEIKKSNSFAKIAVAAIGLFVVAVGAYFALQSFKKPAADQPKTPANLSTQKLTGDGKARDAEISPDGKFLAYRKVESDQESLWIKQVQTNSAIEVVHPGELVEIGGLQFSPDGNFVFFNAVSDKSEPPTVYRVPTLGGSPVKFLADAYYISFSSDARQTAFTRYDAVANETAIYVADSNGANERKLNTKGGKQFFAGNLSWSPDGKFVASASSDDDLAPSPAFAITVISVSDGNATELGSKRWEKIDSIAWHPAGDAVMLLATDSAAPTQLWESSYPSGEARRLTSSLSQFENLSLTADGRSAVFAESVVRSSVWVSPNIDPNSAKQVLPPTGDTWGIAWTPDRKIVYVSDQSGDTEVWMMDADGQNKRQLTTDRKFKNVPSVSPDGRYIVYASETGGGQLVRVNIDGSGPLQLTHAIGADNPDISLDSKWVMYSSWVDGKADIFRVPIEGGEPQRLTSFACTEPKYSPDGRSFACFMFNEKAQRFNKIAVVPADGGEPNKVLDAPPTVFVGRGPAWMPDGKSIVYLIGKGERTNMWSQSLDGGPPKQVTNFDLPSLARREYSRDGKQIAIVRGELTSNAVMITGFR